MMAFGISMLGYVWTEKLETFIAGEIQNVPSIGRRFSILMRQGTAGNPAAILPSLDLRPDHFCCKSWV